MRPQAYPTPSPRAPGSPAIWRERWRRALYLVQPMAAEAALGRMWGITGRAVPQRGATGPGAVAWHRASGAQPGYMNRRYRREARRHLR